MLIIPPHLLTYQLIYYSKAFSALGQKGSLQLTAKWPDQKNIREGEPSPESSTELSGVIYGCLGNSTEEQLGKQTELFSVEYCSRDIYAITKIYSWNNLIWVFLFPPLAHILESSQALRVGFCIIEAPEHIKWNN